MSGTMQNFNNDQMLRSNLATAKDPGASGVLESSNKALTIFEIVTETAEGRTLESATHFGVGTEFIVILKTDGGDLTITGAESTVVLADAGDMVVFRVSLSGSTRVWRVIGSSVFDLGSADNVVTRAVAAAGAGLVPVSAGANKALGVATPVAITGDISAYDEVIFKSVLTALAGFGLLTDSTTT